MVHRPDTPRVSGRNASAVPQPAAVPSFPLIN